MRIELLERIINEYDDGRSKRFFCLALTLLPIDDIKTAMKEMTYHKNEFKDKKSNAKLLKDILKQIADIEMELNYYIEIKRNNPTIHGTELYSKIPL